MYRVIRREAEGVVDVVEFLEGLLELHVDSVVEDLVVPIIHLIKFY